MSIVPQSTESIYVVGFPRSGNTWLTRLLADVLQARAVSGGMRKGVEPASEVNEYIALPVDTPYQILKTHYCPALFFKEVDETPGRMVYIYRDFRDVAISAFFFNNWCDEAVMVMRSSASLLLRPRALLRHWSYRRRLLKYVENLSINGWAENVGTWSQHINDWQNVSIERTDVDMVFVSYEELLDDTPFAVLRVIHGLGLPEPPRERLQNAAERQSFSALKRHFQELPDDADVPHGKGYHVRFLRKGRSGDWRRFLSSQMGQIIQTYNGKMLLELGYESDPYWYEKI